MKPSLLRHGFVHRQLEKIEEHVAAVTEHGPQTDEGRAHPAHIYPELRAALKAARGEVEESGKGVYYSRNPVVSMAQSALHERLAEKIARGEVEHDAETADEPFGPADFRWVVEVGLSVIWWRFFHRRHGFCDTPAEATLPERVRLVLFSDWGTGRQEARDVAAQAAEWVDGSEHEVHAIHLGDVYYSGLPAEVRRNVLDDGLWPVPKTAADRIGSWALNGNHDMYSGGHGYFETLLGDSRFQRQRTPGGESTSWFVMRTPHWNIAGLDTAWDDPLPLQHEWQIGHLNGSQGKRVAELAADPERRLLLLSHHQLFTVRDQQNVGIRLKESLEPVLAGDGPGVDAWFWGHEHDCVAYKPHDHVDAAWAIGHGAVPEVVPATTAKEPHVKWEYQDYRVGEDGQHWRKHGFAVLDIDGEQIAVRHFDDQGNEYHPGERLPVPSGDGTEG